MTDEDIIGSVNDLIGPLQILQDDHKHLQLYVERLEHEKQDAFHELHRNASLLEEAKKAVSLLEGRLEQETDDTDKNLASLRAQIRQLKKLITELVEVHKRDLETSRMKLEAMQNRSRVCEEKMIKIIDELKDELNGSYESIQNLKSRLAVTFPTVAQKGTMTDFNPSAQNEVLVNDIQELMQRFENIARENMEMQGLLTIAQERIETLSALEDESFNEIQIDHYPATTLSVELLTPPRTLKPKRTLLRVGTSSEGIDGSPAENPFLQVKSATGTQTLVHLPIYAYNHLPYIAPSLRLLLSKENLPSVISLMQGNIVFINNDRKFAIFDVRHRTISILDKKPDSTKRNTEKVHLESFSIIPHSLSMTLVGVEKTLVLAFESEDVRERWVGGASLVVPLTLPDYNKISE